MDLSASVTPQEAVYQAMPELWIRKVFPGALYANSNIPEKLVGMMLSKKRTPLLSNVHQTVSIENKTN